MIDFISLVNCNELFFTEKKTNVNKNKITIRKDFQKKNKTKGYKEKQ